MTRLMSQTGTVIPMSPITSSWESSSLRNVILAFAVDRAVYAAISIAHVELSATVDRIIASTARDDIPSGTTIDGVVASGTEYKVIARATADDVIAHSAVDHVVSRPAVDGVVSPEAEDDVVAALAVYAIRLGRPHENVVTLCADDGLDAAGGDGATAAVDRRTGRRVGAEVGIVRHPVVVIIWVAGVA